MDPEGKMVESLLGSGDCIGGYVIERLLGKGGMGAVYLVHAADGRRYALKVMKPDDGDAYGFRARFTREAEFAMNIRHYESHKTYTGTYREQRPISGAQFDNNTSSHS